jgi:hypothetical protein
MGRPAQLPQLLLLPITTGRRYYNGDPIPTTQPKEGRPSRDIAQAAHLRGTIARRMCTCCRDGRKRRFNECITLEGWMKGRCSNCHWAMDQRQCTFPPQRQPEGLHPASILADKHIAQNKDTLPALCPPAPVQCPVPARHTPVVPDPSAPQPPPEPIQALWSEDPTIPDPALVRLARSMPLMKPGLVPCVQSWLDNDWRMDGLVALEEVRRRPVSLSHRPNCELPCERDQTHKGSLIEWLGYYEELRIDHANVVYMERRWTISQKRWTKLSKHQDAVKELLGFIGLLQLSGDRVHTRKLREDLALAATQKMKRKLEVDEAAMFSLQKYIKARAIELERWYHECNRHWRRIGEGGDEHDYIERELSCIPFAYCIDSKERNEIGWEEITRGPTLEDEHIMMRRRLAEFRVDIISREAEAEEEIAIMRRLLKKGDRSILGK